MNELPGLLWLLVLVTALMGLYGFWRPVAFFKSAAVCSASC